MHITDFCERKIQDSKTSPKNESIDRKQSIEATPHFQDSHPFMHYFSLLAFMKGQSQIPLSPMVCVRARRCTVLTSDDTRSQYQLSSQHLQERKVSVRVSGASARGVLRIFPSLVCSAQRSSRPLH